MTTLKLPLREGAEPDPRLGEEAEKEASRSPGRRAFLRTAAAGTAVAAGV